MPVSTTHVLSSGVAGTMAANRSGLQTETLRNLLMAWVLTLPVCVFLGSVTFAAGLILIAYNLVAVVVPILAAAIIAFTIWRFRRAPRKTEATAS